MVRIFVACPRIGGRRRVLAVLRGAMPNEALLRDEKGLGGPDSFSRTYPCQGLHFLFSAPVFFAFCVTPLSDPPWLPAEAKRFFSLRGYAARLRGARARLSTKKLRSSADGRFPFQPLAS